MKRFLAFCLILMFAVNGVPAFSEEGNGSTVPEDTAIGEDAFSNDEEVVSDALETPVEEVCFELGGDGADDEAVPANAESDAFESEDAAMGASSISGGAVSWNGHQYQLFDVDGITAWEDAKAYCESMGGYLATITSHEEQQIIEGILSTGTKNSYWIGGKRDSNGDWHWVTGESWSYTNWCGGQPDNYTGHEDSVMMYRNANPLSNSPFGCWNDLNSDGTCYDEAFFGSGNMGFICEWGNEIRRSGVLRKGDGWQLTWSIDGGTFKNGAMNGAGLTLSVSGSNAGYGTIMTYSDQDENNAPWLDDQHGITRDSFSRLDLSGAPSNPLYIVANQFKGYRNVTDVVMRCVEQIGACAFADCGSINTVNGFGKYLLTVESGAFKNCTSLRFVFGKAEANDTIHVSSVNTIGDEAFYNTRLDIVPIFTALTSIGSRAFAKSGLEEITMYPTVSSIATDAFEGCGNLTIYAVRNSYPHKYALEHGIAFKPVSFGNNPIAPFDLEKDSWNFGNSNHYFGPNGEKYFINSRDYSRLVKAMPNFTEEEIRDFFDSVTWIGSCAGMSDICVLSKWGLIEPSAIQAGREYLHDITKVNNDDVESYISFHQLQQCMKPYIRAVAAFRKMAVSDQIESICRLAENANNGDGPFILSFSGSGSDHKPYGHRVVGYGLESGKYTCRSNEYDTRILLYDCDYPNSVTAMFCNRGTSQYAFEKHNVAHLSYAGIDPKVFAPSVFDASNAIMCAHMMYTDMQFSINVNNDTLAVRSDTYDEKNGIIVSVLEGGPSGMSMLSFLNGAANFSIKPNGATDFTYSTSGSYYNIQAAAAKDISFASDRSIALSNVDGNYRIAIAVNEKNTSIPWSKTSIMGKDSDISVIQENKGLVLNGNDLTNVTVVAENDIGKAIIQLDTDQNSVLLTGSATSGEPVPMVFEDKNGDGIYETPTINKVSVTGIRLDKTSMSMNPGQTAALTATVSPANATNREVTWSSSDPSVAAVSGSGVVTAKAPGTATISARSVDNGDIRKDCVVTVKEAINEYALARTGSNGTVRLSVGEQLRIVPAFAASNGWSVKGYKSGRTKCATVDGSGLVTAIAEGKSRITVTTANRKKATLTIQVIDPYKPTGISIDQGKQITIAVGETIHLSASLKPGSARSALTWKSGKTKVATVDGDGMVTGVKKGAATITVRTANGKKASVKVTVVEAPVRLRE